MIGVSSVAEAESLSVLFVGADSAVFAAASEALTAHGHAVQCIASPFRALTATTTSPPGLVVVDASRLDDQMLEVFEALKEVAPETVLLAAVTPAARSRAARVLNLGSDAIVGLPADAGEIEALVRKIRRPPPAEPAPAAVSIDEKFRWLGEFAAGVAHNINNPLTTVIGYLQILCAKVEKQGQVGSVLPTMLKECDRIAEIVKNLLLFSGNGTIQPRPVDVNRAVDAALLVAGTVEQNDRVETERSYQPGLPAVMADQEALKLACENIAVNARRAMKDGGTLSVETSEDRDGHVFIRFSDTGPGIPEEKIDKVFEPFYTGRNGGSVGLGLATSYGIVKGFGGHIRITSGNGSGTSVLVELPTGL